MSWKGPAISLVIHGMLLLAVSATAHDRREKRKATTVSVRKVAEKDKKKEDEKKKEEPPPPPPKPPPPKPPPRKQADTPAEPKPAPVESTPARKVVDLGLMLSSDAPSGVGIAVPVAPRDAPKAGQESEKAKPQQPAATRKRVEREEQACGEAPTKPEPSEKIEIEYPMSAREAGVEGRLVLRVYVAADGSVEKVEVLSGLGELIDPVAIGVVKRWRFTPALQCGKPVSSVYTLARRFELGD